MSDYKVLFLDIDGTIIGPNDSIEESTITAINQALEKGIEVFLATGRPLHEIHDLAKELNIHSFIGYNGAYGIYQGKDLFQEPMNAVMVRNILTIAEKHKHEVVMYTKDKNTFTNMNHPSIKEFIEKFSLKQNKDFSPSDVNGVLGMTLVNLKEKDITHYQMDEGIHLSQVHVHGMLHCYDVIRDKVNKGMGIQFVLNHLGIQKEYAIAFGDGMNDKEMLMNVGEGFAMGNGHPDLFQYAKHKTTSVNDSGIYHGLKMLGIIN
ncbi:Cof-type HAD-IIB family hydrolase [Neobacillus sp. K501]